MKLFLIILISLLLYKGGELLICSAEPEMIMAQTTTSSSIGSIGVVAIVAAVFVAVFIAALIISIKELKLKRRGGY